MQKLAVIVPSRGLMFSETFEELLRELKGIDHEFYFAHGRPLPECFNEPTEKALEDEENYAFLFCEDDMILPEGILRDMFNRKYPAVALDYPFKQQGDSTCLHDPNGDAFWTGTGFLLLARPILENLEKPIWRTNITFDPFIDKDTIHFWPRKLDKTYYGLHDLRLGLLLYSSGLPIKVMNRTAGQRKLISAGEKHTNSGQHAIVELTQVGRDLVSGMINKENADLFRGALNRIQNVRFHEDIPDWIGYDDNNQPYLKDGRKFDLVK